MTLSWFADADTHKLAQHRDYLSPRYVSCKHIMHKHVCVCVCFHEKNDFFCADYPAR